MYKYCRKMIAWDREIAQHLIVLAIPLEDQSSFCQHPHGNLQLSVSPVPRYLTHRHTRQKAIHII